MEDFILVTQKRIILHRRRFGRVEDQAHDFTHIRSLDLDREKINRWAEAAARWSGTAFFPFATIFWFLAEAVAVALYALLGLLISELARRRLDYEAALRLAAVGHTPALVLSTALFLAGARFPGQLPCFMLLSTAYLGLAVASQKRPPVPSQPARDNRMLKKSAFGGTFSKTFKVTPKFLRNFRGRQAAW